jgi:hypothetical protein
MEEILEQIADFLKTQDQTSEKKFRVVDHSEFLDDMLSNNKTPFINVVSASEDKSVIPGMSFKTSERNTPVISLLIVRDGKTAAETLKGSKSIWKLWEYTWGLIRSDFTLGGAVDYIPEQTITSKIESLHKNNSFKVLLRADIKVVKDKFY